MKADNETLLCADDWLCEGQSFAAWVEHAKKRHSRQALEERIAALEADLARVTRERDEELAKASLANMQAAASCDDWHRFVAERDEALALHAATLENCRKANDRADAAENERDEALAKAGLSVAEFAAMLGCAEAARREGHAAGRAQALEEVKLAVGRLPGEIHDVSTGAWRARLCLRAGDVLRLVEALAAPPKEEP